MTDDEKQALRNIAQRAADQLGEHFDSVRVFVTKQDGENTIAFNPGCGNHYASLGHVSEWLEADKARIQHSEKPPTE
jgi:hypothetical protein